MLLVVVTLAISRPWATLVVWLVEKVWVGSKVTRERVEVVFVVLLRVGHVGYYDHHHAPHSHHCCHHHHQPPQLLIFFVLIAFSAFWVMGKVWVFSLIG